MSSLDKFCCSCTYLKVGGDWPDLYGNYWCTKKNDKVQANNVSCYNYCRAYSLSDSTAQSYYDESVRRNSSGCFITTITSKIMNLDDRNIYLTVLRNFRNNYMIKNIKTIKLLKQYDEIGPIISDSLINDPNQNQIADYILNNYIVKSVEEICSSNYEKAIETYTKMIIELVKKYKINSLLLEIPEIDKIDDTLNYETLGHARIKKILV